MKKILFFATLLSITNLSFATTKESVFLIESKTDIKNRMKDPESIQFRNLREIKNSLNVQTLCGELNGKNSYGGYGGFRSFSYTKDQLVILDSSQGHDRQYDISGCAGKETEMHTRKFIAKNQYCNSIYDFYTNVLANNIPISTAMDIFKSSYNRNHYNLIKQDFSEVELLLNKGLQYIESDKKIKKKILIQDSLYKHQQVDKCESTYD